MFGTQGNVWLIDDVWFLIALIPFVLLSFIIILSVLESKHRSVRLGVMSSAQRVKVAAMTLRARALSQLIAQPVRVRARRNRF